MPRSHSIATPPPRDRLTDLQTIAVKPGHVLFLDFCRVFGFGVGNVKQATQRVSKRLRDDGVVLDKYNDGTTGSPKDGSLE